MNDHLVVCAYHIDTPLHNLGEYNFQAQVYVGWCSKCRNNVFSRPTIRITPIPGKGFSPKTYYMQRGMLRIISVCLFLLATVAICILISSNVP